VAVFNQSHESCQGTTVARKHLVDQFVDVHGGQGLLVSQRTLLSNERPHQKLAASAALASGCDGVLRGFGMEVLRSPGFWLGVALTLLGFGNWIVGHDKVLDHHELLRRTEATVTLAPPDDFEQLNERTNATLLKPFRVSSGRVSALEQKLDFYRVVEAGGRVMTLLGLIVVGSTLLRQAHNGNRAVRG
jgi:hypothetical protein